MVFNSGCLVFSLSMQKLAVFVFVCCLAHLSIIPARFTPVPISAITGTGTGDLLDMVCSELKKFEVLQYFSDKFLSCLHAWTIFLLYWEHSWC
jgi:hypothetical protein